MRLERWTGSGSGRTARARIFLENADFAGVIQSFLASEGQNSRDMEIRHRINRIREKIYSAEGEFHEPKSLAVSNSPGTTRPGWMESPQLAHGTDLAKKISPNSLWRNHCGRSASLAGVEYRWESDNLGRICGRKGNKDCAHKHSKCILTAMLFNL